MDAPGMAAEPQRRWIAPPQVDVDRKHTLVNLDCDNSIGARFFESVVGCFVIKVGSNRSAHIIMRRGHESATTGRIGYTADLWTLSRGYDEVGILGSGSQDIDMANRRKAFTGDQVFARYSRGSIENSRTIIGYPLPQ